MNWRDRIVIEPGILVGKPIVTGTRLSVDFVLELLGRGYSQQQALEQHDHLTPEDVQGCLAHVSAGLRLFANGRLPDLQ